MNDELQELFGTDQDERMNHPDYGTPEYWSLRARDAERRKRLAGLIESCGLKEPEDHYHAAWILNHGESAEEIWQAHILAKEAVELGLRRVRWLAAASYDRWLIYQGKPQKYGTQIVFASWAMRRVVVAREQAVERALLARLPLGEGVAPALLIRDAFIQLAAA